MGKTKAWWNDEVAAVLRRKDITWIKARNTMAGKYRSTERNYVVLNGYSTETCEARTDQ